MYFSLSSLLLYNIIIAYEVDEVLEVGRHCKVTKGGRIYSYSALVLLGTGKGTAGIVDPL